MDCVTADQMMNPSHAIEIKTSMSSGIPFVFLQSVTNRMDGIPRSTTSIPLVTTCVSSGHQEDKRSSIRSVQMRDSVTRG
jgi:hypothetical protein